MTSNDGGLKEGSLWQNGAQNGVEWSFDFARVGVSTQKLRVLFALAG
jgi:hypothetical protein